MRTIVGIAGMILLLCATTIASATELIPDDVIYTPTIKTVLLHPYSGQADDPLRAPVIAKGQTLLLQFDELGEEFQNYYAKIVNCNSDWTIANTSSFQIVENFNEFLINDRQASAGTITPYIHYQFVLPRILISGNFIVKVYKDYDEEQLALSKRFIVFENRITVTPNVHWSNVVSTQRTHQQVDFSVNLNGLNVINPFMNLKVMVRQNFRFDNAITGLVPTMYGNNDQLLEYFYYNNESSFPGGFEFRRFEGQSTVSPMFNVAKIYKSGLGIDQVLYNDQSTNGKTYTFWRDVNGYFMPYHYETQGFMIEPDYTFVNFALEQPAALNGKVYVFGALSGWKLRPEFEMKYDALKKTYTCRTQLKQGYYNYRYVYVPAGSTKPDETYFEGSHSVTENFYDILIYYREPGGSYDRLIGYAAVDYMKQ